MEGIFATPISDVGELNPQIIDVVRTVTKHRFGNNAQEIEYHVHISRADEKAYVEIL